MVVGDHQLRGRAQHTAAFDAPDRTDRQCDVLSRDKGSGRREDTFHARPCIGRPAHDLDWFAVADIDHADLETVRIGMFLGRDDGRNHERLEQVRLVLDVLDLKADHRKLIDELGQRRVSFEVVLQPGITSCRFLRRPEIEKRQQREHNYGEEDRGKAQRG